MVSLAFVQRLAEDAGALIEQHFSEAKSVEKKDSYADLVTEYDKKVEETLKESILSRYPTHKFIAEEGNAGEVTLTDDPTWIIDPIDGTTNFINKFPFVCVSIAYFVDKKAQIGVVYNPILKCLYTAESGKGAMRNGVLIQTSKETDISQALVLTDWGGDRKPENLQIKCDNMRNIISRARGLRTMGSAALHMCQVAAGNGDAFFEFGIHCWDYAAATLIVREAGGYCCNFDGSKLDLLARNSVCAATPELAKTVCQLIKPIIYPRD